MAPRSSSDPHVAVSARSSGTIRSLRETVWSSAIAARILFKTCRFISTFPLRRGQKPLWTAALLTSVTRAETLLLFKPRMR